MKHLNVRVALVVLTASIATMASAHHSFSAFDMQKEITLQGEVLSYQLQNPHAHLVIKVRPKSPGDQLAGNWDIEGAAANIMRRQGWSAQTVKVGDTITIIGHPLRSGDKGVSLFYAITANGARLYQDIARPIAAAK